MIQKAVANYFRHYDSPGLRDVVKFITQHDDILDFCISKKSSKKFTVWYQGKQQQRLNRFYICKKGKGGSLFKSKDNGKSLHAMPGTKGYSVMLYNDHDSNTNIYDHPIYYNYYINEANKIIYKIEESKIQLSLF